MSYTGDKSTFTEKITVLNALPNGKPLVILAKDRIGNGFLINQSSQPFWVKWGEPAGAQPLVAAIPFLSAGTNVNTATVQIPEDHMGDISIIWIANSTLTGTVSLHEMS